MIPLTYLISDWETHVTLHMIALADLLTTGIWEDCAAARQV